MVLRVGNARAQRALYRKPRTNRTSDCQIMVLVLTSRGSPTPSTLRLGPRSKDSADLTHVERDGSISDSQVPVREAIK